MTRIRLLIILALAVAVAPVSTADAHFSGRKPIWGPVRVQGISQFPIYQDLGVGTYQTALDWASVAPTRPRRPSDPSDRAYRWPSAISDAISQARQYNMRVL